MDRAMPIEAIGVARAERQVWDAVTGMFSLSCFDVEIFTAAESHNCQHHPHIFRHGAVLRGDCVSRRRGAQLADALATAGMGRAISARAHQKSSICRNVQQRAGDWLVATTSVRSTRRPRARGHAGALARASRAFIRFTAGCCSRVACAWNVCNCRAVYYGSSMRPTVPGEPH